MQPTDTIVFVKESTKTNREIQKNKWEVVQKDTEPNYEVVAIGAEVKVCRVGDFILFSNSQHSTFNGEPVIAVEQADIYGVSNV